MSDNQGISIADLVRSARERLSEELRAHAAELQLLEQSLEALHSRHKQLELAIQEQLDTLENFQPPAPLEKVLAAVRSLITATLPGQVFDVLSEEAEQIGVRAAVFDVRGKAAWGASARGFGPELSEQIFRALVVPLNQDNPFRQAYETGGHVDASADLLKKNRNILDKFKPASGDPILLLPIRSAGSVAAIFYADPGGKGKELPIEALKILAEFAGAQLDRLMVLSGGLPGMTADEEAGEEERATSAGLTGLEASTSAVESPEQVASTANSAGFQTSDLSNPLNAALEPELAAAAPVTRAAMFDISQLSEADQKVHKDARRFAKLLVSEIELYNKAKVADGRKNEDLYGRLKADIDRSRQTYEKRFGKTVATEFDYFHDELVRILAGNNPSLLGSDYPGPSV